MLWRPCVLLQSFEECWLLLALAGTELGPDCKLSWWLKPQFSSFSISWCLSYICDSAIRQNFNQSLNGQNIDSPCLALSCPEFPTHLPVTVPNSILCSLSQKDSWFLLSM